MREYTPPRILTTTNAEMKWERQPDGKIIKLLERNRGLLIQHKKELKRVIDVCKEYYDFEPETLLEEAKRIISTDLFVVIYREKGKLFCATQAEYPLVKGITHFSDAMNKIQRITPKYNSDKD